MRRSLSEATGSNAYQVGGSFETNKMHSHLVQRGAILSELVDLSVRSSDLFRRHFKEHELTENMRMRDDASYTQFVRRIGNGADFEGNEGDVGLPEDIVSHGDLTAETFGELFERRFTTDELVDYVSSRAILAPLNRICDQYNSHIVDQLPQQSTVYASVDVLKEDSKKLDDVTNYPPEFLNTLNPPELPPHRLVLKEKVVVLLMRNLWVEKSMCNGTR